MEVVRAEAARKGRRERDGDEAWWGGIAGERGDKGKEQVRKEVRWERQVGKEVSGKAPLPSRG